MRRIIKVVLGEKKHLVGRLYFNAEGNRENSAFEFDDSWLNSSEGFSIDPFLQLIKGPQYPSKKIHSPFHSAFTDTEPDGWGRKVILRDHAKRKSTSNMTSTTQLNALDFLLYVDDHTRMGALRFQDENGIFQRRSDDEGRKIPPLIELEQLVKSSQALETNTETEKDLNFLRGKGTSLGGLRPKCTVVDSKGRLSIAKFPSVQDERSITKAEVLAMKLAKAAGIHVPKTELVYSQKIPITLVQRFDRDPSGERIHYISAATLLGVDPTEENVHTYTEIVDVLRTCGAKSKEDSEELWRRIAFSILITNVDDHLRNHGFLHSRGDLWELSPAFDINPFPDKIRELKTWISEDSGPEASLEALIHASSYFGLNAATSKKILKQVLNAVLKWRSVGTALGMDKKELDEIADAFEHPEKEKAKKILLTRG